MKRKLLVTILCLAQAVASAAPQAMGLKDFKVTPISSKMTEVIYKGETFRVERVGETHFKLNGKDVIYKNTDTLESVYEKMFAAYKASGKKSAALDSLFMPKAHAMFPAGIAAAFALIVGLGIGTDMGKKQCEQGTATNGSATPPGYAEPMDQQVTVPATQ